MPGVPQRGFPPTAQGQHPARPGFGVPQPQGIPPRMNAPQQGAPRPAFAPPPPRFREVQDERPLDRLRAQQAEAAKDAELAEAPKERSFRPWMAWTIAGVAALAAIALVVGITLGSAPTMPSAQPGGTNGSTPTAAPATSTFQAPSPAAAAPGALIPITQDVKFEQGITFKGPMASAGWSQDSELTTRDPNAIALHDAKSVNAITFTHSTFDSKSYRDEDVTRSALGSAPANFVNPPSIVGEPTSYTLNGQGGYQLELLAQKMQWGGFSSGQDAVLITRYMPQSDAKVEIIIVCPSGDFENPNSKIRQKLNEITFTTP